MFMYLYRFIIIKVNYIDVSYHLQNLYIVD